MCICEYQVSLENKGIHNISVSVHIHIYGTYNLLYIYIYIYKEAEFVCIACYLLIIIYRPMVGWLRIGALMRHW